jgi:DNA repair photolyase
MASAQIHLFPDAAGPSLRDVADAIRLAGIEGLSEAQRRSDQARYQEVHVKSAVTEAKGMPFKWALNPYRGCTHACEYCYARKYQRHLELDAGDAFSSLIFVKTNLPEVLAREVRRASWDRQSVSIGSATDPYQPIEGHYRLTRKSIEILAAARTPVSIITKGPMVVRDIDVLIRARDAAGCSVNMSIPSVDEDAWRKLEPGTASPKQRLRAVRQLMDAGIDAGVLMMPLVPGITTSRAKIEATLTAVRDAGARFVGANVARFDPGVREHFFQFLEREYPDLVSGYERLYPRQNARPSYVDAVKRSVVEMAQRIGVSWSGRYGRGGPSPGPRSADGTKRATSSPRR